MSILVIVLNILGLISVTIVFIFSCLGFGKLFLKIINENILKYELGYIGIIGIFNKILLVYITSIFTNHGYIHNIVLLAVGLLSFFLIDKINFKIFKKVFIIILFTFSFFLISKTHDDFGYYHLPFALNLVENKIQFGLGNLNLAFRHHSSILFLNSVTYYPYFNNYLFNLPNYVLLIFINLILINEILINKNKLLLLLFSIFFFILINIKFTRLSEYGTDIIGQFISIVFFLHFIKIYYYKDIQNKNIVLLIILFLIIISIKSYFIPYVVVIIYLMFLMKKNFLNIYKKISYNLYFFSILFILLNYFLSFISTGCLVYPIQITCVGESYDWSLSLNEIERMNIWLELWSKSGAGPGYQEVDKNFYISNFNWLQNWFNNYFFTKVTDYILINTIIILVVFIIFKSQIKFFRFDQKKIAILIPIIFIFILWFIKHPALRYGGYLPLSLMLFFLFSLIFKENEINHKNYKKKINVIILFVVIIFNIKNLIRLNDEYKTDNEYKFENFPFYFIKEKKFESRLIEGKNYSKTEGFCWSIEPLCSGSFPKIRKNSFFIFIQR